MKCSLVLVVIVLVALVSPGTDAQTTRAISPLRVGAAKVDVTPSQNELPKNGDGILDHLYARAIVLDNGAATAALVTVDAGGIADSLWQAVSQSITKDLGIPATHVLLTATHTHSAGGQRGPDYARRSSRRFVSRGSGSRRPASGYGTGESYINVNRQIIDPKTGRWWEGPNREGPSDKTVAVVKFETISGAPLAVYYNYAVHGVITGQLDQVSGDIPGATSRYIEDSFDDTVVAVWSNGAGGDQNPIYYQQTYDLRDIRTKEYASRGVDISNAMPPGGQGLNRNDPVVARLMNQQRQMASSMGQFLGEEVRYVMRGIERLDSAVPIAAAYDERHLPGSRADQ